MKKNLRTIENTEIPKFSANLFNYQPELTKHLDKSMGKEFDQNLLNEIVLWKINRYAIARELPLNLLNSSKILKKTLNEELTRELLLGLLDKKAKGIRLPMASTILRFRNPHVYQIIDQRAYRFANLGKSLKLPKNIDDQIELYINYLKRLREISVNRNIKFETIDRLFYAVDKDLNKGIKIEGYGF